MLPIAAHAITVKNREKGCSQASQWTGRVLYKVCKASQPTPTCPRQVECSLVLEESYRLHQAPSPAKPNPAQTKSYIQALKDRYRRASNPRKSKQTRREEKQSLGRGEDTIFQAITKYLLNYIRRKDSAKADLSKRLLPANNVTPTRRAPLAIPSPSLWHMPPALPGASHMLYSSVS